MATNAARDFSTQFELARESPLTKLRASNEKNGEGTKKLSNSERLHRLTIISYTRYMLVGLSVLIHFLIFLSGLLYYGNRIDSVKTLQDPDLALLVADASSLVLHFDLALILLPVCRTLLSLVGRTSLRFLVLDEYAVSPIKRLPSFPVTGLWVPGCS